jgi:hypothetical protein
LLELGLTTMGAKDGFLPSWRHSRQLTFDFIAAVPDARWDWSPHPRYAVLAAVSPQALRTRRLHRWKVNWGL